MMAVRDYFHLWGLIGVVGLFGFPLGWFLDDLTTDRRAPVVGFTSVEALNSPIYAGEDLLVRVVREKVRDDCPVTSLRSAVDQDGRVWEVPDVIAHAGGPADVPYIERAYPIPFDTPPGSYELRVHLVYDCPGAGVFHYDQPAVRFQITEEM